MKITRPGGSKAMIAENIALRHQLMVSMRYRKRAPNLSTGDRVIFGLLGSFISHNRLKKLALVIKPITILKLHKALINRKYKNLFSKQSRKKPGQKGPQQEIVNAIIEMKKRNVSFGYLRIAMQIYQAFGIKLDAGVVRRVLVKHYNPTNNGDDGPSWLSIIGHMKDSLWSIDFFRVESIHLRSHWVMLVMDQFTRRIIGFSVHRGDMDGVSICCMFNRIMSQKQLPKYLSSDNDPLFQFYRWRANLRVLDIEEIKSVPYTPISHPFVERLIGTIRREYLDRLFFWNERDLENKLNIFQDYYNESRAHSSLQGELPDAIGVKGKNVI
jgi:transposase InsO family protein